MNSDCRFPWAFRAMNREPLRSVVPEPLYYWLLDRAQGVRGKGFRPLGYGRQVSP